MPNLQDPVSTPYGRGRIIDINGAMSLYKVQLKKGTEWFHFVYLTPVETLLEYDFSDWKCWKKWNDTYNAIEELIPFKAVCVGDKILFAYKRGLITLDEVEVLCAFIPWIGTTRFAEAERIREAAKQEHEKR